MEITAEEIERCIQETAQKHEVSLSQVRNIIYKTYPHFHPAFSSLPNEMIVEIISHLNPYDLTFFCLVSSRMREICRGEYVWKRFWRRYVYTSQKEKLEGELLATTHSEYHQSLIKKDLKALEEESRVSSGFKTKLQKYLSLKAIRGMMVHLFMGRGTIHYGFKDLDLISDPISKKRELHLPGGKFPVYYRAKIDLNSFFSFSKESKHLVVPSGVWAINCSGQNLKKLTVPKGLSFLDCGFNSLEHLEVPDSLAVLFCSNNGLQTIDLKRVIYANVSHNRLESIDFQASRNEDVYTKGSKRVGLYMLQAFENDLTVLDLSKSYLKSIDVSENKLKKIILPKKSPLEMVDVSENKLPLIVIPRIIDFFYCKHNPWKRIYLPGNKFIGEVSKCAPPNAIHFYQKIPDVQKLYSEIEEIAEPEKVPVMTPEEIIKENIPYNDLIYLCESVKEYDEMCNDSEFWYKLFERDFGPVDNLKVYGYQNLGWKLLYRNAITMQGGWSQIRIGHFAGIRVLGSIPKGSRKKIWKLKNIKYGRGSIQVPEGVLGLAINTDLVDVIEISKTTRILTSHLKSPPSVYALSVKELKKYVKYIRVLHNVKLVAKLDKHEDLHSLPKALRDHIKGHNKIEIPPDLIGARSTREN